MYVQQNPLQFKLRLFDFPKSAAEYWDVVRQPIGLCGELRVADCNLLRKQPSRVSTVVPHKILRKNPNPEYCNKEVKRLKAKVRRVYNKRKLGERYQVELKSLSKE